MDNPYDLGEDMELIHQNGHWIIIDNAGLLPKEPMVLTDKQFIALMRAGGESL